MAGTGVGLKVWVVARLLGRDAFGRVIDEHQFQQRKTGIVEVRAQRLALVADPFGERTLEIGVRGDAVPDLFRRGSKGAMHQ